MTRCRCCCQRGTQAGTQGCTGNLWTLPPWAPLESNTLQGSSRTDNCEGRALPSSGPRMCAQRVGREGFQLKPEAETTGALGWSASQTPTCPRLSSRPCAGPGALACSSAPLAGRDAERGGAVSSSRGWAPGARASTCRVCAPLGAGPAPPRLRPSQSLGNVRADREVDTCLF